MSACNVIKTEEAIYLFSDAASYWGDGTLGAVSQKVSILAHLNCAISCRGPRGFAEELAQAINGTFGTFDELVDSFALAVSNFYTVGKAQYEHCATGPEVEVFLAGWSESRGKAESYVVTSHSLNGPAWTLQPLGPLAVAPYDADLDARCAALKPGDDAIETGVALMEEQRKVRGPHAGAGPSVAGVGGFCQVTVIRPHSIQTAVVRRWPDRIGAPLGEDA